MTETRTMLLLGASGFAGSHLRDAAAGTGLRVLGTSRSGAGADLAADLLDPASLDRALSAAEPELVVNMAGSASVRQSWKQPQQAFAVNATGAENLLEAVRARAPGAHLLFVSSAEVYGEVGEEELPLREDHPLRPASPYAESKAAMEELCERYGAEEGLRIVVVRSFNQLGPGQAPDFVASDFARQIAAAEAEGAESVTMRVGNLEAARDFTDVRDGARAFLAVSEQELGGRFNMCSGEAVRVESLIERMREETELAVEVERDPELARPVDVPVVFGSAERLHEATGWQPRIPLQRSLAELLDWWRTELAA